MYLLKPAVGPAILMFGKNSHSTMYLLKLANELISLVENAFTFHHVSIKTCKYADDMSKLTHSHSTMYLLKRRWIIVCTHRLSKFTFHHVSIKTRTIGIRKALIV